MEFYQPEVHARLSGTFEKLLRAVLRDGPADAPVTGVRARDWAFKWRTDFLAHQTR